MTAEESATRPESRLEGSLAWIFWTAAVYVLGYVLMVVGFAAGIYHPVLIAFQWMTVKGVVPTNFTSVEVMISTIFSILWALVFVIMTLLRVRATPKFASAGAVIWMVLKISPFFSPLFRPHQGLSYIDLTSALLPNIFIELMPVAILVAGFCGYMLTAHRPNGYYLRRLPAS